jgi:hypothetical protein
MGRRKAVGGQEDLIEEVALEIQRQGTAPKVFAVGAGA